MFERRSLGIAFEADGTVIAAELVSGLRSVTLSGSWSFPAEGTDPPDSWRRGIEKLRQSGIELDNAVVGIPESLVFRKNLSFPFSSRKRIMQILNSELEGEIPLPIDKVVADFVPGVSPGAGVTGTAMACHRDTLSQFLELFGPAARLRNIQTTSVGLTTLAVRGGVSEGVAVYCGPKEAVVVEIRAARMKSVKRLSLTGSGERDVDVLLEGIRQLTVNEDEIILSCREHTEEIRSGLAEERTLRVRSLSDLEAVQGTGGSGTGLSTVVTAVGLALAGFGTGETASFDLRQGPFRQVTPLAGLKAPIARTSVLIVMTAVLALAGLAASYSQSRAEYEAVRDQLKSEFTQLFPGSRHQEGQEAGHIKGELDKLKRKMADLSGMEGRGALQVLAGLSEAVPKDLPFKLEELSYDSNKLRFEGSVSSFDAVDRVKAALESAPLFTDVQVRNARVGADINKVSFRLQMEVR